MGNFGGMYLDIGPVSVSYHLLDFMDDPINELWGASITLPVGKEMKVSFSGTRNTNEETWMWLIGGEWTPNG
jgi:hypothetical protein